MRAVSTRKGKQVSNTWNVRACSLAPVQYIIHWRVYVAFVFQNCPPHHTQHLRPRSRLYRQPDNSSDSPHPRLRLHLYHQLEPDSILTSQSTLSSNRTIPAPQSPHSIIIVKNIARLQWQCDLIFSIFRVLTLPLSAPPLSIHYAVTGIVN